MKLLVCGCLKNGTLLMAKVDDWHYDKLAKHCWHAQRAGNRTWYAEARINNENIYMHWMVAGRIKGKIVHHKNGDGLDNQEENLEVITHRQHSHLHTYKGSITKSYNRYSIWLSFPTEEDAKEALRLHHIKYPSKERV